MGLGGFANFTAEALSALTGAGLRTARRWRAAGRAPAWALRLLVILVRGELGAIHPAWEGWSLRGGKLHAPLRLRRPQRPDDRANDRAPA